MSKRNAALEALGGGPSLTVVPPTQAPVAPVAAQATPAESAVVHEPAPKAAKTVDKVMLYLPPKVARKFKEMAFHEECKAHDLYLQALEQYLAEKGHPVEAALLKR